MPTKYLQAASELETITILSLFKSPKDVRSFLLEGLKPNYFQTDSGKAVFKQIKAYFEKYSSIPSFSTILSDPEVLPYAKLYLAHKDVSVPKTIKEAEHLLENVKKIAKCGKAIDYASKIVESAEEADLKKLKKYASKLYEDISQDERETIVRLEDVQSFSIIEKILEGEAIQLIKTRIQEFDKRSGGFPRGQVVLLAANTGGGKSTLAMNLAVNQALEGLKVLYVSLEMDEDELVARIVSRLTRIPFTKIYKGEIVGDKAKRFIASVWGKFQRRIIAKGGSLTIKTPSQKSTSMSDIAVFCERGNYDIVYVDYINLLRELDGKRSLWENLGESVRIAKTFVSSRPKPKPCFVILVQYDARKEQVRYSRAMVEHAALVWAWIYDDTAKAVHKIKIKQQKARNQPIYDFWIKEDFEHCTMEGITIDEALNLSEEEPQVNKSNNEFEVSPEEEIQQTGLDTWIESCDEEEF